MKSDVSEYPSFESWEAQAEVEYCVQIGRTGERSIYTMFGQQVFEEVYFPHSFFEKCSVAVKATGFNMRNDDPIMQNAASCGAVWEQGYYAETGYGWPVWSGETAMRDCYNWLLRRKTMNIKEC